MNENISFKNYKDAVLEFNKRFANGDQYIKLKVPTDFDDNWVIESEENKAYYWQQNSVFNHILPLVEFVRFKGDSTFKGISEEEIYGSNGLVERLIPIQRAYNAVKNRELEYINRVSAGVIVVEDGSVDVDDLEEDGVAPGKVIVYRSGSNAPVIENQKCYTNGFVDTGNNLLNEMNIITMHFLSSRGIEVNLRLV